MEFVLDNLQPFSSLAVQGYAALGLILPSVYSEFGLLQMTVSVVQSRMPEEVLFVLAGPLEELVSKVTSENLAINTSFHRFPSVLLDCYG